MAQFKVDQSLIDETFGANTTPTEIQSQIDAVQPSPVQKDTFNAADRPSRETSMFPAR